MGRLLRHPRKAALILITRPATAEDAAYLAPRLRPEDAREIAAASGRLPEEALSLAVGLSTEVYTFRVGPQAQPFCMFGVAADPSNPTWGVVWFVGTPDVSHHGLSLIREAPFWLKHWHRRYVALHNCVDVRHTTALRWAKSIGFVESSVEGLTSFIHIIHWGRSR